MRAIKATHFVRILIASCLLLGCRPAVDQILEEMIDQRHPIEPAGTISITNRDGSIRIYGAGSDTREVRIEAIKKAYSAERLKAISVQVSAQPHSISIDTIYPPD